MHFALATIAMFFNEGAIFSPYIIPVAGCAMVLGIVIAGVWSSNRTQELRSRERLECIARGMTPPPTVEELAIINQAKIRGTGGLSRRRANIRLAGVVLLASSAGIIAFFVALSIILTERDVLSGAAVGLIPLAIGVGFLIDTKIQSKEIDRIEESNAGLEPLK